MLFFEVDLLIFFVSINVSTRCIPQTTIQSRQSKLCKIFPCTHGRKIQRDEAPKVLAPPLQPNLLNEISF